MHTKQSSSNLSAWSLGLKCSWHLGGHLQREFQSLGACSWALPVHPVRFAPADFPRQATARTQEAESTSLNFPQAVSWTDNPIKWSRGTWSCVKATRWISLAQKPDRWEQNAGFNSNVTQQSATCHRRVKCNPGLQPAAHNQVSSQLPGEISFRLPSPNGGTSFGDKTVKWDSFEAICSRSPKELIAEQEANSNPTTKHT